MKVYVSEKENINLKYNKECKLVLVDSKPVISMSKQELNQPIKTFSLEAKSLEQHEAEIKAPLLEEIETLKNENYQLKLMKQRLAPATLPEGEYALHYLSSDRIRKQTKQEVIDELLAFIKENQYCVGDYIIENHYYIATDKLKQKLNQMKWE